MILTALVHAGQLTVAIPGKKFDATHLRNSRKTPVNDLINFKHVERPKDLPLAALTALFELLGIPKGLLTNPAARDEGVSQLQTEVGKQLERLVKAEQPIQDGVPFWNDTVLSKAEQDDARKRLQDVKEFPESLHPFNRPGKLKNFKHDSASVLAQKKGLALLGEEQKIVQIAQERAPAASPAEDQWTAAVKERCSQILADMKNPKKRADANVKREIVQSLAELRQ